MSEIFDKGAPPQEGDRVRRPLHGLPYDRFGTVSSVETAARPKPWVQVEWIGGGTGWYTQDELMPVV